MSSTPLSGLVRDLDGTPVWTFRLTSGVSHDVWEIHLMRNGILIDTIADPSLDLTRAAQLGRDWVAFAETYVPEDDYLGVTAWQPRP